jgi:hypothetical protein
VGSVAVAKREKDPGKTSVQTSAVQKRPQPHGGALQTGNPGNKGGGRTPSALRDLARGITEEALPRLRLVALGEPVTQSRKVKDTPEGPVYADVAIRPDVTQMLDAFDRLVSLGMGEELRTEDIRKRLERQAELLADALPPELLTAAMQAIAEAWA